MGLFILGPLNTEAQEEAAQAAPAALPAEIQEDHDTQNLNKVLKEYNQDSEKVLRDAQKLVPKEEIEGLPDGELGGEKALNPDDESNIETKARAAKFDPNMLKKYDPKDMKNVKYSEMIRGLLEPIQKMPEKEIYKLLAETTKDTAADGYINSFPKIAVFMVSAIKDKEAIPSLVSMADDQDKAVYFGGTMLFTILFGILLKKFLKKEGRSIKEAIGLWFFRFCLITSLRLAIIIFFFGNELTPIVKIAARTLY